VIDTPPERQCKGCRYWGFAQTTRHVQMGWGRCTLYDEDNSPALISIVARDFACVETAPTWSCPMWETASVPISLGGAVLTCPCGIVAEASEAHKDYWFARNKGVSVFPRDYWMAVHSGPRCTPVWRKEVEPA
jgi:hypothetical protein